MTITDEMLYGAAPEAAERFLAALPDREACEHPFSPAFEEAMRPLLAEKRRKPRRWSRLLVLAAVLAALAAGISVGAGQKPSYQVYWSQADGNISYSIRADADGKTTFRAMKASYVPEGWVLDSESVSERSASAAYRYGEDAYFTLRQTVQERKTGSLLGDTYQAEAAEVSGQPGILVRRACDGALKLMWTDGPNILELDSTGLSREEVMKIAENIHY